MRGLHAPILTAAALLGGCASFEPPPYAWKRDDTAEAARLVLTRLDATPVLTLACAPGSGAVDVTLVGYRADGAVIELHARDVWNRYTAAGHAEHGPQAPLELQTRLAAADPVLTRFADTGDLTIVQGDMRLQAPNAFAPAHDVLKLCRAG